MLLRAFKCMGGITRLYLAQAVTSALTKNFERSGGNSFVLLVTLSLRCRRHWRERNASISYHLLSCRCPLSLHGKPGDQWLAVRSFCEGSLRAWKHLLPIFGNSISLNNLLISAELLPSRVHKCLDENPEGICRRSFVICAHFISWSF